MRNGAWLTWALVGVLAGLTGCSGDDDAGSGGSAGSGGATGGSGGATGGSGGATGGSGGATGGSGGATGGSGGATGGSGGATGGSGGSGGSGGLGGVFRYGINGGHRNTSWGDATQAELEVRAGCNSARLSLPERHLEQWGYDIEVGDMQSYAALGLHDHVAFLTSPIASHSTAPPGTEDWKLAYYTPKNLYEPVTLANGDINPDNYWGYYVYRTVSTYNTWVKVWEIWNEPDWVSNWNVTQTWGTEPPLAADLPRFNGSIYEYVRMLRVSQEAAKLADPGAKIATGGLGYETFLSAILRYTDNPADGSVTAEYPDKGGAYFEVLSFHHYPIYTAGNSDDAVDGYLQHLQAMADTLSAAGATGKSFVTTESGAPHVQVGSYPGGEAYARNYLMKVMTAANIAGVLGIDWYTLSDYAEPGSQDPYAYMGLFDDIATLVTTDQAQLTPTGVAYRTLGTLLADARYDTDSTTALALPPPLRGAALRMPDNHLALVLWATVSGAGEDATAAYSLSSSSSFRAYAWDHGQTDASTLLQPDQGEVVLELTGTPQIFIEQ